MSAFHMLLLEVTHPLAMSLWGNHGDWKLLSLSPKLLEHVGSFCSLLFPLPLPLPSSANMKCVVMYSFIVVK